MGKDGAGLRLYFGEGCALPPQRMPSHSVGSYAGTDGEIAESHALIA